MARLKQLIEFIKRRKKLVGFFTIIVLVVFFVTLNKVYHYSETNEFCASCHEMDIHYESFMASKHNNEHVEHCHACHVGPGLKGYAHAKLSDGTHDSLMHSFQAFSDGSLIEVAEDSLEIINGNCERCHEEGFTKDKTHIEFVSKSSKRSKDGREIEKLMCTDCHLGVAHPHMPGDLYDLYAEKKVKPYGKYKETDCFACHKIATPDVVKQWTGSPHAAKGVTCISCHGDDHGHIAKQHGRVSASACGECHMAQFTEFQESSHLQGRSVAFGGTYDVITTRQLSMEGCRECHKMGLTYEDDRVGGSCNACHGSHKFSTAEAKAYDACEKCHVGGPEHSQLDSNENSIFGKVQKMRSQGLISNDLVKCQTCHGPNKSHNFNKISIPQEIDVLLFGGHGLVKVPEKH